MLTQKNEKSMWQTAWHSVTNWWRFGKQNFSFGQFRRYVSSMHSSSPAGPIVTTLARTKDAFAFHLCPIEGLMRSRSTFARTVTRQPKLKLSRAHSLFRLFVRSLLLFLLRVETETTDRRMDGWIRIETSL
jgi:hypothetical protein